MILRILEILGLRYNPERHAIPAKRDKAKRRRTVQIQDDDGIQFDNVTGKRVTYSEQDAGASWESLSGTKRLPYITNFDLEEIRTNDLDPEKYRRIKIEWAKGSSARDIAKTIKEKGFGKRTCETYLAAINRAEALSPTD